MESIKSSSLDPVQYSNKFIEIMLYGFDQLDTMAGMLDIKGNVIYANQAALRNVGATLEQVQGLQFCETPWRKHSLRAKNLTNMMIKKALAGEYILLEDTFLNPDGERVPTLFSISPIIDKNGDIIGLNSEGKVISELKKLEECLKDEREESQKWIDSMGAFIAKSDPNGKILACNKPFLQALDMSYEEVTGHYICDMTRLGNTYKRQSKLRTAIFSAKAGASCSLEIELQLGKLPPKKYLFNVNPITDENGLIKFLALEITDISTQVRLRELMLTKEKEYSKRLQQEVNQVTRTLQETEQFNKNMIDSAPMSLIYLDNDDCLLFANPKMESLFRSAGIATDKILGKQLSELGFYRTNTLWKRIKDSNKAEIAFGQMRMILYGNNNQNKFHFEVECGPLLTQTEGVTGTILMLNDVSKRVKLESELLRTRIQAEKMSSLGLLISGVAHEINNPLTSILGCAEFLTEEEQLSNDAQEAIKIIIEDARRASKIVKNLLSVTQQKSPQTFTSLNEIITDLLKVRTRKIEEKGIKLVLKLDQKIRPIVADATQIQQMLMNFINNAIDAIKESGIGDQIIIRTKSNQKWIVMEVEDNGPGISNKNQSMIFDPFFTTKQPGKGTGLGLSIAYSIIERHGGTISLETPLDHGTKFIIRFPQSSINHQPQKNKEVPEQWIPAEVLVVEDEKNLSRTLTRYLLSLGSSVDIAENGLSALGKIKSKTYDLMLVDVKMPQMGGVELFQELYRDNHPALENFVFMTGFSGKKILQEVKNTNVPVLQKPFSRQDILKLFTAQQARVLS